MIHSLYSNKEIFLRELISNASDAADKLRFEAIARPELFESDPDLKIHVAFDASARTITIADNGVGHVARRSHRNIGTIARSGTREFFQSLSGDQAKDANLIGQFGVGFYSSFIVADRVTLVTRRAGLPPEEGVRWECDMTASEGQYTIENDRPGNGRGTEVTLHLREGEDDLLSRWKLAAILRKYSDHIALPIVMAKEEWDEEKKEPTSPEDEVETINQARRSGRGPKAQITEEQYTEFYKHVAHDTEAPLAFAHAKVEGRQEYTQLLYVPARAPVRPVGPRPPARRCSLYVRRVFIMDDAEQLLPAYLRFVRGVVDSSDLPLNVSREILQESKDIEAIRKGCASRILGLLEELAGSEDQASATSTRSSGPNSAAASRRARARISRTASASRSCCASPRRTPIPTTQDVALADYLARMKDGQDAIYYVTADTFAAAKNSPHLEIFRKKGIEVLLLADRVDEWVVSNLHEFDGKPLKSVAKGALDLDKLADADEKKKQEEQSGEYKDLLERIKTTLGDKVADVRVTLRLTESPACLVVGEHEPSGQSRAAAQGRGTEDADVKPVLEINPQHPIVQRLKDEGEARFADWASVLFDQALLAEGGQLEDPAGFVRRMNELMLAMAP